MGVLEKRQPSFVKFREYFFNVVKEVTGQDIVNPYAAWQELGDAQIREQILSKVKSHLESEYGFEVILPGNLVQFDGAVESVANQIHHNFSTVYLVERINAKIFGQRQK
ncbi:hypothetical protein JOC37_001781 [Desulfohalotomaculum tongense]|uniref:hypothetical protein n=1 Tax=Desulforadius tongensis TaxID=1216062 RepID=UPI00195B47FA|nr:hypothetical protein [Desulforadius tongensis]MBM7855387.1 hypothetical protein [Desulforadius tongensis]